MTGLRKGKYMAIERERQKHELEVEAWRMKIEDCREERLMIMMSSFVQALSGEMAWPGMTPPGMMPTGIIPTGMLSPVMTSPALAPPLFPSTLFYSQEEIHPSTDNPNPDLKSS